MIRLRLQKRLFLDDVFLYIGVICLGVAAYFLWRFFEVVDQITTTYYQGGEIETQLMYTTICSFMIFTYSTIYFVKLSFLFFFRILVRQDHKLMIYWWMTFVIINVALLVSVAMAIVPIPMAVFASEIDMISHVFVVLAAIGVALDVATDVLRKFDPYVEQTDFLISPNLVLIIPFVQLWRIQISLRKKFILGATLCLSIFMIIVAILRISILFIGTHGSNLIWMVFWQLVEASTAVIMVSFSAFRSLFIARETRLRENKNRHRHWYMSRKNRMAAARRRIKLRSESEKTHGLPEIPRATMTGMSTFIRGEETRSESRVSSLDAEVIGTEPSQTLADVENAERIRAE